MPAEYFPILDDLEALVDRTDLPAPLETQGWWKWYAQRESLFAASPFNDQVQKLKERAHTVLLTRYVTLLHPGERDHWEGDSRFVGDDAVYYAIEGHVFACCYGDGKGNIARSQPESELLREIFGNPFRPVTLDPRWLTSTVVDLARAIYEERIWDRMPILSDALMDAGCDNDDIISHCRGDRPHVRGCWVVDLILGKE